MSAKKMKDTIEPWILFGYELFAQEGPQGLKVEVLSKKVGKSKSSFYHHFADMEVFTEVLLDYHVERAAIIAKKERECKIMVPDMLLVLLEFKTDLLFSRQLRVNRNIHAFNQCFIKTNKMVEEAFIDAWMESLGLEDKKLFAKELLKQNMDNFFVQITAENFTYEWILSYMNNVKILIKEFKNSVEIENRMLFAKKIKT